VATDDFETTDQGVAVSGSTVLSNDVDPDSDPLTVSLFSSPASGTVVLQPDGMCPTHHSSIASLIVFSPAASENLNLILLFPQALIHTHQIHPLLDKTPSST